MRLIGAASIVFIITLVCATSTSARLPRHLSDLKAQSATTNDVTKTMTVPNIALAERSFARTRSATSSCGPTFCRCTV